MPDLFQEAKQWKDTEAISKDFVDRFTEYVNGDAQLKEHRDHIEKHAYGFGERAFHWLWKLVIDEMPTSFNMLEIGVYKGQVLSLVRLLTNRTNRVASIVGVTPLSTFAGRTGKFTDFPDCDYRAMINNLHDEFNLEYPTIIVGDSTSLEVHTKVSLDMPPFDIVYIDGCHEYAYVANDLIFYIQCLKVGGYLVVDDSACHLKQAMGYFQGIQDVSEAVRTIIEPDADCVHLFACMHNRVWRKVA